jgi:hypothetical protein
MSKFATELRKDLEGSEYFSASFFDADKVIGKRLTDIHLNEEELTLTFEDGAVIEIILNDDNIIDIQTD